VVTAAVAAADRVTGHAAAHSAGAAPSPPTGGAGAFIRQLAWREFAAHVLHHFPHTVSQPLRPEFAEFPWTGDPDLLKTWRAGRTGYPLVDAGMRELAATGWMHNRVRLVCGSFLTKDLLVPWTDGLAHFTDTLFDHDAAPYFRVFNPVIQGRRFDPDGTYVRRWVPELAAVPARWIHEPWNAPHDVLREAQVEPGREYPLPVVDHFEARDRALAAYAAVRK
jgi:deoxyribodipyrimidine photo-lyase